MTASLNFPVFSFTLVSTIFAPQIYSEGKRLDFLCKVSSGRCLLFNVYPVSCQCETCSRWCKAQSAARRYILQQPFAKYVYTVSCQCETCSRWCEAHSAARRYILQQPFVKYVYTVSCQCETRSGWFKAHCAARRYLAIVCTTRIAGKARQCGTTI